MGRYLDEPSAEQLADFRVRLSGLSPRDRELIAVLATGLTSSEAGEKLGLSRRTVENRRLTLVDKLGVRNLVEAIVWIAAVERTPAAKWTGAEKGDISFVNPTGPRPTGGAKKKPDAARTGNFGAASAA